MVKWFLGRFAGGLARGTMIGPMIFPDGVGDCDVTGGSRSPGPGQAMSVTLQHIVTEIEGFRLLGHLVALAMAYMLALPIGWNREKRRVRRPPYLSAGRDRELWRGAGDQRLLQVVRGAWRASLRA